MGSGTGRRALLSEPLGSRSGGAMSGAGSSETSGLSGLIPKRTRQVSSWVWVKTPKFCTSSSGVAAR